MAIGGTREVRIQYSPASPVSQYITVYIEAVQHGFVGDIAVLWNYGDGAQEQETYPHGTPLKTSHSYDKTGDFTISALVKDARGDISTPTVQITIVATGGTSGGQSSGTPSGASSPASTLDPVAALNNLLATLDKDLSGIGHDTAQALIDDIATPARKDISAAGEALIRAVKAILDAEKKGLLAVLPKSPDQAVDAALGLADVGIVSLIAGEILALLVEAVYPTKHLGITEALHKALEISGISEITASLFSIIVESGFRENLRYYFNYNLQPRKLGPDNALRALWYGQITLDQYASELRFEGYSDGAVRAITGSAYRPMPPFLLEKLVELGLLPDDLATKQLQREGFDPKDIPALKTAFQNLKLSSFQSTATSIVFSQYRDGFIDATYARNVLTKFAIPQVQQDQIMSLANLEFDYAQKQKVQSLVLAELGKGTLKPQEAVDYLVGLGMAQSRAEILVDIQVLKIAPALSKSQKAQIFSEIFG